MWQTNLNKEINVDIVTGLHILAGYQLSSPSPSWILTYYFITVKDEKTSGINTDIKMINVECKDGAQYTKSLDLPRHKLYYW